jgi:hypothetical protein
MLYGSFKVSLAATPPWRLNLCIVVGRFNWQMIASYNTLPDLLNLYFLRELFHFKQII